MFFSQMFFMFFFADFFLLKQDIEIMDSLILLFECWNFEVVRPQVTPAPQAPQAGEAGSPGQELLMVKLWGDVVAKPLEKQ